jgi:hypothetical protein
LEAMVVASRLNAATAKNLSQAQHIRTNSISFMRVTE